MDLKDKEKIVQIIGTAETSIIKLEENVNALRTQGKTPSKADAQLLRSISVL